MADQTFELYTASATGAQIDNAAAKVAAMEETLSGTAATIPSSAAVKNYVDSKSVDTESTLSGNAVYDISEANNGTTYANLAAALNNGNNIPASIRKGGISIKFIQSSDNKYVQYRLMAQAFSTTVSDWQGVDDAPTANSKNLVTSGGVHGALLNYTTTDALTLLLAGKQDVISDLATIRNGATAGATAVQPSDLAPVSISGSYNDLSDKPTIPDGSDKEDKSNKVTSWQATPDTIHYPSEKLVKESIDEANKLVEVQYGVTTYVQVKALIDAGKIPYISGIYVFPYDKSSVLIYCTRYETSSSTIYFTSCYINRILVVNLLDDDTWSTSSAITLQNQVYKVDSFTGKIAPHWYPSTKAVADYAEKKTDIVAPVNTTDVTLPITTLSCEVGKYYRIDVAVSTLAVTLPTVTDATYISNIVFMLTTGTTPAVTFTAPSDINVYYQDGFEIKADSTYEINALFNGTAWVVTAVKINVE